MAEPHRDPWPISYASYCRGCRCEECREKAREYRRGRSTSEPRKVAEHGTRSRYLNCTAGFGHSKCEPCRAANREYQREYMAAWRNDEPWGGDPLIEWALSL